MAIHPIPGFKDCLLRLDDDKINMMLKHIEPRKARRLCLSYCVLPIFHTCAFNLVTHLEKISMLSFLPDLMRCSSQDLHGMVLFAFLANAICDAVPNPMHDTNDVFKQNNTECLQSSTMLFYHVFNSGRQHVCFPVPSVGRRGQVSFLEASRFAQEKEH